MYEHNHFVNYIIIALSVLAITITGVTYSSSVSGHALTSKGSSSLQVSEETPDYF